MLTRFDGVLTQRVVINFLSWEEQKRRHRAKCARRWTGGLYAMIENTYEDAEISMPSPSGRPR